MNSQQQAIDFLRKHVEHLECSTDGSLENLAYIAKFKEMICAIEAHSFSIFDISQYYKSSNGKYGFIIIELPAKKSKGKRKK